LPANPVGCASDRRDRTGAAKATIITTNLHFEEWLHNFLGNKALVTVLLSRLRHQCHTVRIEGPSLRDSQG